MFLFSALEVLTAATPTISYTVNNSVHKKTTEFSSQVILMTFTPMSRQCTVNHSIN